MQSCHQPIELLPAGRPRAERARSLHQHEARIHHILDDPRPEPWRSVQDDHAREDDPAQQAACGESGAKQPEADARLLRNDVDPAKESRPPPSMAQLDARSIAALLQDAHSVAAARKASDSAELRLKSNRVQCRLLLPAFVKVMTIVDDREGKRGYPEPQQPDD